MLPALQSYINAMEVRVVGQRVSERRIRVVAGGETVDEGDVQEKR